jgi:hypothetical protein
MNKSSKIKKKPSQRRYHKKSGINVWTSGRLVNVWNQPRKSRDAKDVYVHVHTRNIPWIWVYFRDVKSPFVSLLKGGVRACVKGFTTFEASTGFWRLFVSLSRFLWLVFFYSCVRGSSIFFRTPQQWRPPCFNRKTTHNATANEV